MHERKLFRPNCQIPALIKYMWPELLDMTREESKRILRRVELEAYSSVVSAFRAQGDLTKDKKRLLHDLQQILSISTERHRAEVRRAVNDEKLATIADNMSPSNSTQEWLIEGRRLVPLMPRLVPQTAFTVTANQVANMQAEKNASLPSPSQTGIREAVPTPTSPTPTPITSRPSSPTSNVVVLPSGMSIHIKGGLNTDDEDDIQTRKRRRSTSTESLVSPTGTPVPQVTYTTTIASVPNVSPKKITISKSPQATTRVVASGSQTQKVILVSSQGQASSQTTGGQKTISMPIVRSTVSTGTSTTLPNKSIIFPPSSTTTITTSSHMISVASPSTASVASGASGTSTTAFLTPTISVSRPRFRTMPRQKILQLPSQSPRPGVVIPMGPQPVQPSPQTFQGSKPATKQTPTIQIRQEGGMKIITQSVQAGTSKILPKPSQMSTSTGTPVVVVSAGTSTTSSSVTVVTRPGLTGTPAGTKVLNIQTQGGKIITAPRGSSVVTVNPKTLHLTAVKNASGIAGAKPNVIVVQKTQPRRSTGVSGQTLSSGKGSTTVLSGPFEKELVSFLQKQDPTKQYVVTTTTANLSRTAEPQRKVIVTTSAHGDLAKQLQKVRSSGESSSHVPSNILQDLIQAAGIVPDGNQDNQAGEVTINLDEAQLAALTSVSQAVSANKVTTSMPNNEWFEYDVTDEQGNTFTHTAESADTAAAIQSLLDMQANGAAQKPKVTVQRSSSVDIGNLSDQLNSQQFYTIEQAMTILNQEKEPVTSYIQTDSQSQTTLDVGDSDSPEILTAIPYNPPTTSNTVATTTMVSTETVQSGDLDPQTGMFYVDKNNMGNITHLATKITPLAVVSSSSSLASSSSSLASSSSSMVRSLGKQEVVMVPQPRDQSDLLSSSLAQAQIDLDPYQFFDEGQGVSKSPEEVLEQQTKIEDVPPVSSLASEQVLVHKMVMSTPITTTIPAIRIQPSSFIPLQDMVKAGPGKSSTINITTKQSIPVVSVSQRVPVVTPVSSIHVTVEPSGLDTSHMKMEDFSSQQFTDKAEFVGIDHMEEIGTAESPSSAAGSSSLSDSQGEGSIGLDQQLKRKRKLLSSDMEGQGSPPAGAGGWVRAALGVLNKVSRYRGANRDKNELNAATWFTQPVDPADAPDYYTIVENPMDFGTIKKKLELGKYLEFEDFHSDMMLVRDNCYLYNPEQSLVRQDCEEVFTFYCQEHEKLLDKWHKTHIASPISKKPRLDRSPI